MNNVPPNIPFGNVAWHDIPYCELVYKAILQEKGFACFVVNRDLNILQAIGEYSNYANNENDSNKLRFTSKLFPKLQQVLFDVSKGTSTFNKQISIGTSDYLNVTVNTGAAYEEHLLIFINPVSKPEYHPESENTRSFIDESKSYIINQDKLQKENEELRQTNEALRLDLNRLNTVNNDLQCILDKTETSAIFLDKELRIRHFSGPIKTHLGLQETDIGKDVNTLAKLCIADQADRAINKSTSITEVITCDENKWFKKVLSHTKILPMKLREWR